MSRRRAQRDRRQGLTLRCVRGLQPIVVMLLEAPEGSEGRIVDETKVERCVAALVADLFRQGGHLTQDDFQKVVDRRRLAADEVLETYRRLRDDHTIAVERSGSPERRQPRRPSASDSLSMLLADLGQYRLLTRRRTRCD